jgi:hypothetical protein
MRFLCVSRAFLARFSCISRAFLVRFFAFLMRFFCVSFAFLSPRTPIQVLRTRSSMQALPIKVLPTFSQATLIKMNIQTRPILSIMVWADQEGPEARAHGPAARAHGPARVLTQIQFQVRIGPEVTVTGTVESSGRRRAGQSVPGRSVPLGLGPFTGRLG